MCKYKKHAKSVEGGCVFMVATNLASNQAFLSGGATQLFTRPHSIGCENNRHRNITRTLSLKQWSRVLWRTNEVRGI